MLTSILLISTLVACSRKYVNQSTDLINSKEIQSPQSAEDNNYLKKKVYKIEDFEKLLESEKIITVKQRQVEMEFNRLQEKYPTEYYIDDDDKQVLRVYVFDSENERINAKLEYDKKTELMNMTYRKIYEVKNIMVFLMAGDDSNQYYQKVFLLTQKMQ